MKKIFLLLLTLISINVQAENRYTDFEFKELVEERQNDDEFNKYESITFNKFYKPVEIDTAYVEGLETDYFAYVDPSDYQIDEYTLQREPMGYPYEGFVTINSGSNYQTDQLIFEEIQSFENTISKLEIYSNDTPIDANIEIDTNTNKVNIYLDKVYYINDLKLIFHYDTEENYNFIFTYINKSNLDEIMKRPITLNHGTNKFTLFSLKEHDYTAFIKNNNFSFKSILYYYYFTVTRYKHYNIQKDYYIDSEENEIEGYTYDPAESYTMYKHYTRELLEQIPPIENIPIVEEKPKEENLNTNSTIENPQATSKEKPKKVHINVPNKKYNTSNKIENTEKESNTYPAVVDTTKNEQSITNLENKKDDKTTDNIEKEETKCETKTLTITVLLSICLVLILIDTVFSSIDLIKSVNKKR